MNLNPYASPVHDGRRSGGFGKLIGKVAAAGLWFVCLLLIFGVVTSWNRPEIVERREESPVLSAVVWIVGIVLPTLGFALLGLACWARRWGFVFLGLGSFMPLVLYLLYFALRGLS